MSALMRQELLASAATAPVLRGYQDECVAAIRQAFARWRRVLFVLPTGGGKTVVFAYITSNAAAKGNRVIVLAHRQEIADQISIALTAMGVVHGRIQPGHTMTGDLMQLGMVQTVARRLEAVSEPALLVIDEAHHAVAGTWAKIAAAWPTAKVLGVTATPERLDGVGLRDAFDTTINGPDVRELTDAGHLASFRYLAPSTDIDLSRVRSIGGDYNSADLDGTMSSDQRNDLVNRLRTGTICVLTSCEIISEGFDAPAVGGTILLRPTQSFALFRQQVGRSLRPKSDGSNAIIIDHVGNVFRHGLPDAPHAWSLDSKKRTQAERQQSGSGCRKCKACGEVFSTGVGRDDCRMSDDADCLFRPRILPERAGILEEIVSPPWARGIDILNARGWRWYQLLQHADGDPTRLRQIQAARGYKPRWVRYAVQEAAEKRTAAQRGAA